MLQVLKFLLNKKKINFKVDIITNSFFWENNLVLYEK